MKSLGQRISFSFLCWAYFADQYQIRNYICDVLENRLTTLSPKKKKGIITRQEIQRISDDGIKANSLTRKDMARESIAECGSSR